MKTNFRVTLLLLLAGLPFVAASLQKPQPDDATADAANFATVSNDTPDDTDSPPTPDEMAADAPLMPDSAMMASMVSTNPAPPPVNLSQPASEVVRLAQAGVGEDVMFAYIGSVNSQFNLGSDQIVYLNDIGVTSGVIKAMIDRDATIGAASRAAVANNNTNMVGTLPAITPPMLDPGMTVENGSAPAPIDNQPPPMNYGAGGGADYVTTDDYNLFSDSLAPYGSWAFVSGCGYCWQPTVCVRNHEWRPYCDRGRWVFSNCGWYWQSDYSWGWAAFHYGRWFCDEHRGWCWAPNRTWGPAWVSWRSSANYCGWAPLPPSARFLAGEGFRFGGRRVGSDFEFGLSARHYNFIPIERMTDLSPSRYVTTSSQTTRIFAHTTVNNGITIENHQVVNHGVDPQRVASASGVQVRRAEIHDLPEHNERDHGDRLERRGDTTVIFRPQLPVSPGHRVASTGSGTTTTGRVASITSTTSLPPPPRTSISGAPGTPANGPTHGPTNPNPVPGAPTTSTSGRTAIATEPHLRVPLTGHEAQDPLTQKSYPPNSLVLSGRHENNNNVGTGVTTIVPRVNVGVQPTAPNVATTQPLQTAPRVLAPNRSYQPQSEAQGGQSPAGYPFLNRPAPAAPQVTAPAGNSSGFGRSYSPGVTTIAPAQGQAQYSTPSPRVGGYSQPSYTPPQPTYSAPQTHYTEAAVPSRSYSAPAPAPAPAQSYHSSPPSAPAPAPAQSSPSSSSPSGRGR